MEAEYGSFTLLKKKKKTKRKKNMLLLDLFVRIINKMVLLENVIINS